MRPDPAAAAAEARRLREVLRQYLPLDDACWLDALPDEFVLLVADTLRCLAAQKRLPFVSAMAVTRRAGSSLVGLDALVRRERLVLGLSVGELARRAGVRTDIVQRTECGGFVPTRCHVFKLAQALGANVDVMLLEAGYCPISPDVLEGTIALARARGPGGDLQAEFADPARDLLQRARRSLYDEAMDGAHGGAR